MKKRNLYTLFIAGLLLVITLLLSVNSKKGTFDKGNNAFSVADTASVKKIFLADKLNNQVVLDRTASGNWMVNDKYLVRPDAIEVLLTTAKNLSVDRPVSNKEHNNVVQRLSARSVKVEIYQEVYRINLFDKVKLFPHVTNTKTYFVGGSTQDNLGTYMLLEKGDKPFVLGLPGFRGFISTRYSARLDDWRTHSVFHESISDIQSVKVEFVEEPQKSFEIQNIENRAFTLTNIYENKSITQFDTLKVIEYLTVFRSVNYEALLNDMNAVKKDSIIASKPFHIITMKKTDGSVKTVKTFHLALLYGSNELDDSLKYDADRMYALVNNEEDFVLIQFMSFDKITRPLQYFTGELVEEENTSSFSRVM
ncbi:MAG: DUF4340 domain-containing protein [Bacteroidota bacterium]|nr:DUF4340 domain-containing protein [Bacteroidota bacterium]